jgi:hypothetical protein
VNETANPARQPDLRPIISRLREIQRKCLSLGTRNEEVEATASRLASIIEQLASASDDDAERPDFHALAQQLFPVARLFESLGFMSISREVAYVERALAELTPATDMRPVDAKVTVAAEADIGSSDSPGETPLERSRAVADEVAPPATHDRSRIPKPVGLMLFLLLLAILGSILIVRWHDARQRRAATEASAAVIQPSPTMPVPTASPTPRNVASPTPTRGEELADRIGQARLALQQGDLDRAISLVSSAALIDADSSLVIDTAHGIVDALLARSDTVAAEGNWEREQQLLDRARELSVRFGFPTGTIDDAAHRHAAIIRFKTIRPNDLPAILAATGKRVSVYLDGGSIEEGRIHGVRGRSLELDQATKVGSGQRGGEVRYVEPIHLDLITEIRVYDD